MPNIEWSVPMEIISPYLPDGLLINQPMTVEGLDNAFYFMVRPDGYQIVPGKFRSVIDSISQADGVSMQQPYIDGLVATMKIEYWIAVNGDIKALYPAGVVKDVGDFCLDARLMNEMLMGVLNSLRLWTTDPNTMQRYIWTPTDTNQRLLTNVLLSSWPTPGQDPPLVSQTFSLGTPYPYAIDIDQSDPTIDDGGSLVITNEGNAHFSPVMQVQGPTTVFLITDELTGETVSYDGTRPGAVAIGGGDYAEIDFFQGSIFLNGDGADLVAGLDPVATDLFTFAPGDQTISVTGADVKVLYNDAYV